MEGVVRVFWGIEHSIRIKEFEDKRVINHNSPTKSSPNKKHDHSQDQSLPPLRGNPGIFSLHNYF